MVRVFYSHGYKFNGLQDTWMHLSKSPPIAISCLWLLPCFSRVKTSASISDPRKTQARTPMLWSAALALLCSAEQYAQFQPYVSTGYLSKLPQCSWQATQKSQMPEKWVTNERRRKKHVVRSEEGTEKRIHIGWMKMHLRPTSNPDTVHGLL